MSTYACRILIRPVHAMGRYSWMMPPRTTVRRNCVRSGLSIETGATPVRRQWVTLAKGGRCNGGRAWRDDFPMRRDSEAGRERRSARRFRCRAVLGRSVPEGSINAARRVLRNFAGGRLAARVGGWLAGKRAVMLGRRSSAERSAEEAERCRQGCPPQPGVRRRGRTRGPCHRGRHGE